MRGSVPINLASEPFRRDRPVILLGLAGGALLMALLAFQVSMAWLEHESAAETRLAVERTRRQVQTLAAEQARLEAVLRHPDNAAVLDYSVFYNTLIRRKAISWTRIFADLDEVIPHNVRLVSIRPQVSQNNQIQLDMLVAAASPEPVIELLMKLEGSPLFGSTAVASWLPPSQAEPLFRYRVTANYAPTL